jgi:rare lipoprotein A (peptidoglycan hydrolase)
MQINKTISTLFVSAALLAPVPALAISSPSYSSIAETPAASINTSKWMMEKNQTVQQTLAYAYTGVASWYGPGFYGRPTASGEIYRPGTFTVAHRSLPLGTRVRITNLNNGRSAIARVNDRGPYVGGRIVDLGEGIASHLGVTSSGLADVSLEVLN